MLACAVQHLGSRDGKQVQGQPQLCGEFEASLGYMRHCSPEPGENKQTNKQTVILSPRK